MLPAAWFAQAAEPLTRDDAREAAIRELSEPIYRAAEPSLLDRITQNVLEWIGRQLVRTITLLPGGVPSLVVLVILIVAFLVALRLGLGPLGRNRDLLDDRRRGARLLTARDYRLESERLAAAGEHREALRARFRAIVRELEERGVIDARPGRTAGEIALEAGAAVPAIRSSVTEGAGLFNAVWYGGRAAGPPEYEHMRDIDEAIRVARLAVAS